MWCCGVGCVVADVENKAVVVRVVDDEGSMVARSVQVETEAAGIAADVDPEHVEDLVPVPLVRRCHLL